MNKIFNDAILMLYIYGNKPHIIAWFEPKVE
ncbi:MAG: hypothetical protein ISEC1_P0756 [Thiomicrorhabdus sp.]|nr:MAG: hypothetical protein ISEC1_P0756 [Thiomicrorhabdus sp.]